MSESQPKGELGSEENRTWTGNSTGSTLPSSVLGRDPVILITVLLGLTLRAYFAGQKGLVLDEFHSDFHASRATFSELLQSVRADNHPPLSFALISLAQDLFGKSDFALRIPALIAAALEFTFVGLLARPYGKTACRFAIALVALSSLHLDQGSMARMYAPLAACITGATWASLQLLRGPNKTAAVIGSLAVWGALGLHYFAVHYILWLGLACLLAAWKAAHLGSFVRRMALPLGAAIAAALPWYGTGFIEQLGHGLPPGGDDLGILGLLEGYAHLFFLNLRLGGDLGRWLFLLASLGILGMAARVALTRGAGKDSHPDSTLVLASMAWVVPIWAFALAQFMPRSGFTWHYILPSVAPMAVLAGSCVQGARTRWTLAMCVAAALMLSLLNLKSPGTEDYPGAVTLIQNQWQPGDGVICVEYQPPCFPTGRPWDRYVVQSAAPTDARLETDGIHLREPNNLEQYPRIWLMESALPESVDLRDQLADYGESQQTWSFGWRPTVTLFKRR